MGKPKIGVFKFSSCAGCQLEILNLENDLLDILEVVDFTYFPMASSSYGEGPYDIGLVEGTVTCTEEIEKIKHVREKVKVLVAMGACATTGGVNTMKNPYKQVDVEERVYTDLSVINSTKAYGIDQYVKVDEYLQGCPMEKSEFVEFVKSALLDIKPKLRPHCVCVECKLKENQCIFIEQGKVCMGPAVVAGCGALCPSRGRVCEGCRGPSNDPNVPSLAEAMMEYGAAPQDVKLKFSRYAGEMESFKKGVESL